MPRTAPRPSTLRHALGAVALAGGILLAGAMALAGPYGALAWGEQNALLEKRQARIAALEAERAELANRVELLDQDHADPDLVTELLRRDLNVAHPDEYVIELTPER